MGEQMLSTELETLQRVATQLINAHGTQVLYEQILDSAIAIVHADFASIQMYYPESGNRRKASAPGPPGLQRRSS
jgi:hypothetical protein